MVLETEELSNITGGGISYGIFAVIGGAIAFVIGVIDGYLRPLSCNK